MENLKIEFLKSLNVKHREFRLDGIKDEAVFFESSKIGFNDRNDIDDTIIIYHYSYVNVKGKSFRAHKKKLKTNFERICNKKFFEYSKQFETEFSKFKTKKILELF